MSKELQIATALVGATFVLVVLSFVAGGPSAPTNATDPMPPVAANGGDGFGLDPLPPMPAPQPQPVAPPAPAPYQPGGDPVLGGDPVYGAPMPGDPGAVTTSPGLPADDLFAGPATPIPPVAADATAAWPAPDAGAAPVATADAAPTAVAAGTHTIAKNETLGDISAKHYGTSKRWQDILAANPGLDPTRLKVGQVIAIPAGEIAAADAGSAAAAEPATYTVRQGDSYYGIAKERLGNASRWRELEQLNGIAAEELKPGAKIKLPSKAYGKVKGADAWVVRPGDTLGAISQQHYGTTQAWQAIADANPGVDPADLKVGTRLTLPDISPANVHVVAKGDTLGEISQQHYGTSKKWKDIVEANPGVDPTHLAVGQKLIIPGKQKHAAAQAQRQAAIGGGAYVVEQGDTLGGIAAKTLGSAQRWQEIAAANPGIDPGNLRIGQSLAIPGQTAAAPAADPGAAAGAADPLAQGAAPAQAGAPAPAAPIEIPPEDLFDVPPMPAGAAPAAASAPL